jgi:hypothetical protein
MNSDAHLTSTLEVAEVDSPPSRSRTYSSSSTSKRQSVLHSIMNGSSSSSGSTGGTGSSPMNALRSVKSRLSVSLTSAAPKRVSSATSLTTSSQVLLQQLSCTYLVRYIVRYMNMQ